MIIVTNISFIGKLFSSDPADEQTVKVEGEILATCKMKGCWMNMNAADAGQPEMMVRFKDYGFFVPKDIAGRTVNVAQARERSPR